MTITSQVIADSIADGCPRLTTLQLRYPRFIHAEFMTHRVFSRNASSSRAIPIKRMIEDVMTDPAVPISWGKNQPGMQAGVELPSGEYDWLKARDAAVYNAELMAELDYHKQIVNRILEPFQHINVLVTATEWDNFFALRDHSDAQPEIKALAVAMRVGMAGSEPYHTQDYGWHLPYVDELFPSEDTALRISAARCASVSYKTVDGKRMTVDKALDIYDKLNTDPLHASPFEHIARPDPSNGPGCRNFNGWHQWRADIEGELDV